MKIYPILQLKEQQRFLHLLLEGAEEEAVAELSSVQKMPNVIKINIVLKENVMITHVMMMMNVMKMKFAGGGDVLNYLMSKY